MSDSSFTKRHIGPRNGDVEEMLKVIGVSSIDQLIEETIPDSIRLTKELDLPDGISERDYLEHIAGLANENSSFRSFIGLGYYNCIVPPVIQRNILENPGWYTAYTPYQAEISQGRLEALLNFQTMVMDLTGMEIANASLLDEGTAAGEAMIMFYNSRSRDATKAGVNKFFVANNCYPQTIDILKTRSEPLGIELVEGNWEDAQLDDSYFGALLQYPAADGAVHNYKGFVEKAKASGTKIAVAADILSLALLTPPGEWGADAVVGNTQRLGVPMGYGGPHAAYFATHEEFKRHIPGRIIGVSVDRHGDKALRMALQTREQHIRRDKATSNICTAQALLAVMAGMYCVYHGPDGVRAIAEHTHGCASTLATALVAAGVTVSTDQYFDTITVTGTSGIREKAEAAQLNFLYNADGSISISCDEKTTLQEVNDIINVFGGAAVSEIGSGTLSKDNRRTSEYLTHPTFNSYHSETEMMRYLKRLENKDLSLTHSMISLGSCTMKLNAAAELYPITMAGFANVHPFAPVDQCAGYQQVFTELESWLSEITGFTATSLQPNSGAQGEYAGLLVIKAYHDANGDHNRTVALIPQSAHGTNPASAVMAGMQVVVVKCDDNGNIDVPDLKAKAEEHKDNLAALLVTYPSTHGVFEDAIMDITDVVHQNGGLVYMDGANMNAQVGLTNPATIGADVCHLNLHKTFAIPHGGGGPGMGPIAVNDKLAPYLPGHAVITTGGDKATHAVSAAPWGSALILLISYGYIKMLGKKGVRAATEYAILNANYMKERLEGSYPILYQGNNGHVAHEMILDCRDYKKDAHIEVEDIAKRLIDYGFHAPTVSFPVAGTLMVEPTESESKEELDRFCDAMIQIRREIAQVADGQRDAEDNVLKNAPHTADEVTADNWEHNYSREQAAYPVQTLRNWKYWVPVARVDNAYGDRNLVCACPPMEAYAEPQPA